MSSGNVKVEPLRASTPEVAFSLDDVDLSEQALIQEDIVRYAETLNERAVQEALRRSLEADSSSRMDNSNIADRVGNLSLGNDDASIDGDTLLARGAAAAPSCAVGAREPDFSLHGDSDDELEHPARERSRRGQYQQDHQHKSERRPSLERINGHVRSPALIGCTTGPMKDGQA